MHALLRRIVTGLALATPTIGAAQPAVSPSCGCEEQARCTQVDGIHVVSAQRPVVRRLLSEAGAVLVETEDGDTAYDTHAAPKGAPYSHVYTAYFKQRLRDIGYLYIDAAALAGRLEQLTARHGEPVDAQGALDGDGAMVRTWRTQDGVDVTVTRQEGMLVAMLVFRVPAVQREIDAWLEGRDLSEQRRPQAATAPPIETVAVSARQGVLDVGAREAMLLGSRTLRVDVCGTGDFVEAEWLEPRSVEYLAVFRDDDTLDITIGIHDGVERFVHEFVDVRPRTPAISLPIGDCSALLQASYQPTQSPLCLHVVQTNQPTRTIVERAVDASGVTVDGTDLLEDSRVTFALDTDVAALLAHIADADGLRLERLGETHFAFRRPDTTD